MPTPKRLRDARDKGQVSKSAELNAVAVMASVVVYLALAGDALAVMLQDLVRKAIAAGFEADPAAAWVAYYHVLVTTALLGAVPLMLIVILSAGAACRLQVGSIFSLDPVMPKLERVNPAAGLKRIFSKRTLGTFALSLVKMSFLLGVIYAVGKGFVPELLRMMHAPASSMAEVAESLVMTVFGYALVVFLITAIIDAVMQHHWFIDGMKMAKHEVRRDYKEQEGDPLVKGQRRALAMELAFSEVEKKVKSASVVVVNPTHIAVALSYRPGETDLPMVVAKGQDEMAAMIRRIAEDNGVPVVRDVALARALYEKTPVDQFIGRELFQPVARLLLWVRELESRTGPGGR